MTGTPSPPKAVPPMPPGFADRAAWDAIHHLFAGNGCLLDQAVIGWQKANQERVRAATKAAGWKCSNDCLKSEQTGD